MSDNISSKGVLDLLSSKNKVILIDVRSNEEFQEGHIKGAINMVLGTIKLDDIYALCDLSNKDVSNIVVMICRSGSRSSNALAYIFDDDLYDPSLNVEFLNLHHGVMEWVSSGNELVK